MKKDTAQDQARAQCDSIVAMVAALDVDYDRLEELREEKESLTYDVSIADQDSTERENAASILRKWEADNAKELADLEAAAGDCTDADDARQRIEEDALSVEVRSDWASPGEEMVASEFRIVLCTGGPHVEIVGDLSQHNEPESVRIIYKDWGNHGELFDFDHDAVLRYCSCFYFGA